MIHSVYFRLDNLHVTNYTYIYNIYYYIRIDTVFAVVNRLPGIPPRGRMPSLNSWMRRMPPRPKQLSVQKLAQPSDDDGVSDAMVDAVQLRPATPLVWPVP